MIVLTASVQAAPLKRCNVILQSGRIVWEEEVGNDRRFVGIIPVVTFQNPG
jgi:hypothetical protein